jgi:methylmalonyl-CoA mutase N-terminal domain/subunit
MSFFFNAHSDFFEEVAKFRAARRVWARVVRERFGAADERSGRLRFHAQTAGVSLTAAQPWNNVARTALQALAAVLGGASSLHTNSLDEALGLPTEQAALLALRTQQVIADETNVTSVVDPFGGSWFLERLTRDLEDEAMAYFARIDQLGGMVPAIEMGIPQREIAESAYRFHQAVEAGEHEIVGVNVLTDASRLAVPVQPIDPQTGVRQADRLASVRRRRDAGQVARALEGLRRAAQGNDPIFPILLECARAYASVGEMTGILRETWGEYVEPVSI